MDGKSGKSSIRKGDHLIVWSLDISSGSYLFQSSIKSSINHPPLHPSLHCTTGKKHMNRISSGYVKIAIENGHLSWIFPLKMVIFHSYVSLPEGNRPPRQLWLWRFSRMYGNWRHCSRHLPMWCQIPGEGMYHKYPKNKWERLAKYSKIMKFPGKKNIKNWETY